MPYTRHFCCLLLVVSTTSAADRQHVVPISADDEHPDVEQMAAQTLSALNVIADHYIAAPAKQELVRQAIAEMRRAAKMDPDFALSRRLSTMVDDEEFRQLLEQQWEEILALRRTSPKDEQQQTTPRQVVQSLLSVAPGRNQLSTTQDHNVDRQLAANRYVGVGVSLAGASGDKPPVMVKVIPGGPADDAGALDGDVIIEIDGTSTDGLSMVEVVRLLRGSAGTDVELLLQQKSDEPRKYTITRGVVRIQHTHHERRRFKEGAPIDVIRFDRLTSATVSDLRTIEQEAESPPAVVLLDFQFSDFDRHQAVLLADALLDGGIMGRLETVTDHREFTASRDALFSGSQLVVLVSPATVGTIEWIAAALQDNKRARIIGQQTAGQPFISEAFDVPGTHWVLTLTSGVLKRADDRPLLRSMPTRDDQPVVSRAAAEALDPAGRRASLARQQHDGGVIPDVHVETSLPSGPDAVRRIARGNPRGLITIDDAIKVIEPFIQEGDR